MPSTKFEEIMNEVRKPGPAQPLPLRPRLCSKSLDKLTVLARVAEAFIEAGGLTRFRKIDVTLTWDHIQDAEEGVIAPVVQLKLEA